MSSPNSNGNNPGAGFFAVYSGSSMNPTLRETEVLEVRPYGGQTPRAGDVVFFLPPEIDRPVVHRIVSMESTGVSTRGDNNTLKDAYLLPPERIQGRVIAAWRGQKRRKIAGGLPGRLKRFWFRGRLALRRAVAPLLNPLYRTLARRGLLGRWLPASLRPRVVVFSDRGRDRLRLLLGRRVIGSFDEKTDQWQIRRPFHLLVDAGALPGKGGR